MSPCRSSSSTPASAARARAPARASAADRSMPSTCRPVSCATGIATRPLPTASSTSGPVRLPRELDVQRDVLRHVRRPGVVDRGEGVVIAQGADGIVARWTPRRSKARRGPAIAAASADELDELRIRYLGRKSAAEARASRGPRPRDGDGAELGACGDRGGVRRTRGRARRGARARTSSRSTSRCRASGRRADGST